MLTGQNYAGDQASATLNEQTVQIPAPTVEIPAHLLTYADNWQITEALRLAQDPAITDINRDLVLAAINAAFALGKQQQPTPDKNYIYLTLDPFQPHEGRAESEVDAVFWALENRKDEALKDYADCLRNEEEEQAQISLSNYEMAKQVQWQLTIDLHSIASHSLTTSFTSQAQALKGGPVNE